MIVVRACETWPGQLCGLEVKPELVEKLLQTKHRAFWIPFGWNQVFTCHPTRIAVTRQNVTLTMAREKAHRATWAKTQRDAMLPQHGVRNRNRRSYNVLRCASILNTIQIPNHGPRLRDSGTVAVISRPVRNLVSCTWHSPTGRFGNSTLES